MGNTNDVEYYIDGVNFKDYGVYVSASEGLVGQLAQKEALSVDYENYHGVSRCRRNVRYKERTITLKCFIETRSRRDFVDKVNQFFCLFDSRCSHRLKVEYDQDYKPLVYQVDLSEASNVDKKWATTNDEMMVGTFTLKLIENEPVKRVLRFYGTNVTMTLTSTLKLNIYWGDGSHTFDVDGSDTTVGHTYSRPGVYDIIITGVIEEIEGFDTNASIIWELLK